MNKLRNKQSGFTIVELLIATAVFSVVLLVFLTAFIKISQLFYKGVNMSRTQETARAVLQDISDDIQFYKTTINTASLSQGYFCVGDHRYAFNLHQQVGTPGVSYGIAKQLVSGGCPNLSTPVPSPCTGSCQELLDDGMQVNALQISCLEGLCNIGIHMVFYGGDNSVLFSPSGNSLGPNAPDAECTGALIDSQYCATATYQSTVLQSF